MHCRDTTEGIKLTHDVKCVAAFLVVDIVDDTEAAVMDLVVELRSLGLGQLFPWLSSSIHSI